MGPSQLSGLGRRETNRTEYFAHQKVFILGIVLIQLSAENVKWWLQPESGVFYFLVSLNDESVSK